MSGLARRIARHKKGKNVRPVPQSRQTRPTRQGEAPEVQDGFDALRRVKRTWVMALTELPGEAEGSLVLHVSPAVEVPGAHLRAMCDWLFQATPEEVRLPHHALVVVAFGHEATPQTIVEAMAAGNTIDSIPGLLGVWHRAPVPEVVSDPSAASPPPTEPQGLQSIALLGRK